MAVALTSSQITSQVFCVLLAPFPELKAQADDGNESRGKLNTSSNQVFKD